MKYHELTTMTNKAPKRVGRGISAGQGKTAGRGTKGQMSRTGSKRRPGFEGGQNPLMQRFPKLRGFTSKRTPISVVYTGQLAALGASVDNAKLAAHGLVESEHVRVKLIVGGGELSKAITVKLQSASKPAAVAVEKAGGSFKAVPQVGRVAKKTKADKDA